MLKNNTKCLRTNNFREPDIFGNGKGLDETLFGNWQCWELAILGTGNIGNSQCWEKEMIRNRKCLRTGKFREQESLGNRQLFVQEMC